MMVRVAESPSGWLGESSFRCFSPQLCSRLWPVKLVRQEIKRNRSRNGFRRENPLREFTAVAPMAGYATSERIAVPWFCCHMCG